MILGYHLIFTTYGFWLPNDPRGSWSDFVRSWELLRFGEATKVTTRRSLAKQRHDSVRRRAAKEALAHPPVRFSGEQAVIVAQGFAKAIEQGGYVVHACSIMPDHVHLVIERHERDVWRMMAHLKGRATVALARADAHPLAGRIGADGKTPSPWARRGWNVFLDSVGDVRRAIKYVEDNPAREGLRRQRWSWVTEYAPGE